MKQCIECDEEKNDKDFHCSKSRCKKCISKRRKKEYNSDPETARLEARVYYETPKAAIRRVKNFMARYVTN